MPVLVQEELFSGMEVAGTECVRGRETSETGPAPFSHIDSRAECTISSQVASDLEVA